MDLKLNHIYHGDARQLLKEFPADLADTCITSPPYYGLRDYGTAQWIGGDPNCRHRRDTKNNRPDWRIQSRGKVDRGVGDEIFKHTCAYCGATRYDHQIGLEKTAKEYIESLVLVFREVKRILKKTGTLWIVIGDSYCGYKGENYERRTDKSNVPKSHEVGSPKTVGGKIKPKDMIAIPWMLGLALRDDGWYLRQDIIWNKENPMPESVVDRCTKAHEYILLLSKSRKYYFDNISIKTDMVKYEVERRLREKKKGITGNRKIKRDGRTGLADQGENGVVRSRDALYDLIEKGGEKANKKSVWTVPTQAFPDAHFATYPEKLIIDCVKAGCKPDGVVLDPFMGAGTTALVSRTLGRNFVGIELNQESIDISNRRLQKEVGLFL